MVKIVRNSQKTATQSRSDRSAEGEQAVLIVDDDPRVADVLQEFLKEEGFTVLYEENGRSALHCIERNHPDLVLADMRMPVMDGITLLREITSRWDDIDVIMMSATENPKGLKVPFIQKPFDLDEVMTTISECNHIR